MSIPARVLAFWELPGSGWACVPPLFLWCVRLAHAAFGVLERGQWGKGPRCHRRGLSREQLCSCSAAFLRLCVCAKSG